MLRTERSAFGLDAPEPDRHAAPRQLLLAVAPPPRHPAFSLSGWPTWLIPAYRAGGHRPEIVLLEE
jgi:hypothetical protein